MGFRWQNTFPPSSFFMFSPSILPFSNPPPHLSLWTPSSSAYYVPHRCGSNHGTFRALSHTPSAACRLRTPAAHHLLWRGACTSSGEEKLSPHFAFRVPLLSFATQSILKLFCAHGRATSSCLSALFEPPPLTTSTYSSTEFESSSLSP